MSAVSIQNTRRLIHYYELIGELHPEFRPSSRYSTPFQALLSKINRLAANRSSDRYQQFGDKELFINEQVFANEARLNIIKGKLLSVRRDFFPEIIDTTTDNLRDIITSLESDGVVETSHFLIKERDRNRTNTIKLALEYNQFGARVNDLRFYLEAIGRQYQIFNKIEFRPLIANELRDVANRIGEVSKITVRVHKDNLQYLSTIENNLFGSLKAIEDQFKQEYLTIALKYDVRRSRQLPQSEEAQTSKNLVGSLIDFLIGSPEEAERFETLEVEAEDLEKNGRINSFDLLINKIKDVVNVERRFPSKTIVSADMFQKMDESWSKLRVRS